MTACHCQDECVPIATSSIVSTTTGHSEDYPSPAVTEYLDEGLEAAQVVPCAAVWKAIKELARDPAHFRAFQAAKMLDLARQPLTAQEAAKRLGVKERHLYRMRRDFWERVYGKVVAMKRTTGNDRVAN